MAVSVDFNGWKTIKDSTTSELGVYSRGYKRFEVGNLALTTEGANTAAALLGYGTSTTRVKITSADKNFIGFWMENAATSGDNRGVYLRFYLSGAGGGGECLRAYTEVAGVTAGTAHGAHISLGFGESTTGAKVTGLAVAMRATLGLPDVAMGSGGTYAAIMPEIYSFGAASDPTAMTQLSFIRCVAGGNATGIGLVDDKAYLLVIDGVTEGSGNMVVASATEANYASAARCLINGVEKWLMFASASG